MKIKFIKVKTVSSLSFNICGENRKLYAFKFYYYYYYLNCYYHFLNSKFLIVENPILAMLYSFRSSLLSLSVWISNVYFHERWTLYFCIFPLKYWGYLSWFLGPRRTYWLFNGLTRTIRCLSDSYETDELQ